MKFVLENKNLDKKLTFRAFDVLKSEGTKILVKTDWTVSVTLTINELYLNLWLFPEKYTETKLLNGDLVITFSLQECLDHD